MKTILFLLAAFFVAAWLAFTESGEVPGVGEDSI